MKKVIKILLNKYLLTIVAFLLIMLFFDQNNWFVQQKRLKELKKTEQNIRFLKKESARMAAELKALNTDTAYLEKYAREHYHEKRDDEDVFLILRDTEGK